MTTRANRILLNLLLVLMIGTALFFMTAAPAAYAASKAKASDGQIDMTAKVKGDSLDVKVVLSQNSGVNQMILTLDYDTDLMTLTGVDKGSALSSLVYMPTDTSGEKGYAVTPFKFMYSGNDPSNDTSTGTLFTLHFAVKKGAEGQKTTVKLTYKEDHDISYVKTSTLGYKNFLIKPATVTLGKSSGAKVGLIAGIAAGVAAVGALIAAGVITHRKRMKV